MKSLIKSTSLKFILTLCLLLVGTEFYGQFNRGMGGMGRQGMGGMGRQGSGIPQTQGTPEKPEPQTADQIVDEQMPSITQALELNDFETAVMSSILKKYLQERIELQILQLPPEKMKEAYEKINERQIAEIKEGLPPEKYEAFVNMQQDGVTKTIKKKKKKEKKTKNN